VDFIFRFDAGKSMEEAYDLCAKITAEYAKTFYLGTRLMPPEKARAIWQAIIFLICQNAFASFFNLLDVELAKGLHLSCSSLWVLWWHGRLTHVRRINYPSQGHLCLVPEDG
jgi:hypothetical protein